MSETVLTVLGLSAAQQRRIEKSVGHFKTVTEFFSDAASAVKDTGISEAVRGATPWAGEAIEAFGEALPLAKLLAKLFSKWAKETDPFRLGYLACTLAYQQSAEQAFFEIGKAAAPLSPQKGELQAKLKELDAGSPHDLETFSYATALEHPFVKNADKALEATAKWGGYDQKERTLLKRTLHRRFVTNLKTLLSHGSLRERFAPFAQRLSAGSDEAAAYNSLFEHADRQRRRFEERPLFNQEPFALADVYVDTDCGRLQWSEIRKSDDQQRGREARSIDPFSEEHGGRHDLLETVLGLMKDPNFRDAIVIQGTAGSGKSAFTLRLSRLLIREGLTPLRIRLRDLRLDRPFLKDLAEAALLSQEEEDDSSFSTPRPRDLFLGGQVFKERVPYGDVEICPFVLILDGWDEISVSVEKGFNARVAQMLDQVEREFLRQTKPLVRVILTGRPSTAVEASNFLGDATPILTVRPFLPDQLERFLHKVQQALAVQRLKGPRIRKWSLGGAGRFQPVLEQYRAGFKTGQLEVLGLPLLTHLGLRVMSAWKGDLRRLVESSTSLYRNLVDLTCKKAGKGPQEEEDLRRQARFTGSTLRTLLHRTAAAMTAYGDESVPRRELELRLNVKTGDFDEELNEADQGHPLTKLMISFYFKGGHAALGCEFLHKSFREFLFAEGIVETLKRYGREHRRRLAERESYWEDFRETDPRFNLSRELGHLVAPQWLSPEVVSHLESLITWEIDRAARTKSTKGPGEQTKRLDLKGWEHIRDALADLWDWWGEGVHLRPGQKADEYSGAVDYGPSLVNDLVRAALPRDRRDARSLRPPIRVVTMDAHLGDAICRLAGILHFRIALVRGWIPADEEQWHKLDPKKLWNGVAAPGEGGARKYQVSIVRDDRTFKLFCPFGPDHTDLVRVYASRVNAAGWRPYGLFPGGVNFNGVFLGVPELYGEAATQGSSSERDVPELYHLVFRGTKLVGASLAGAGLGFGDLRDSDLRSADLRRVNMVGSWCKGADLRGAVLDDGLLDSVYLSCELEGASLRSVDLRGADLRGGGRSSFRRADFAGANLDAVDIRQANLSAARGLTQKQINKAFGDESTKLPRGLRRPRHWPKES